MSKRNPIFILVSIATFALAVWMTPLLKPNAVETPNVLVMKYSPWPALLRFENQDLLGLDERSTQIVEGAVEAITDKRYEDTYPRFQPALFRSMSNSEGDERYVLIEIAPLVMIPGFTTLRVHVFDTAGYLLNSETFNAGYRTSVTSMRIRDHNQIQQPVLIVEAEYCLGGHPSTQYYALRGNRMELIYLEQDGKPDSNDYQSPHMTIGPKIERSFDEWEKALGSSENVEVLSALVWFNGNPPLPGHKSVQNRLQEVSQSENFFIKTVARSVLENSK